ncbi:hypothetical protein GUITHDRAFT_140077 [Guillardia theta CCMP2712]|uniref:Uncharacterized protein n=1 Tax=Guillardia theta (strain CCMP2712) TaxID=905079 RepID=L1J780_GUITC|nr:hypothetical protein GUITHDRAFT_140077 [Guillardia theta CCMP2712]EKX43935.1 hypothetical protein GUITHDRAFT_140077 [Guillardia theta CCMP2712]|eukprot:XP_005830915.1 hypothetical protein GUITHDRAFT_140077 [Guillardia theta CCMP2712]
MSSIGSMSMQVDSDDLKSALQRAGHLLKQFIQDDSQASILIHNGAKGLSVWLEAPSDADIKNSFSFIKKDGARPDPSKFWGLSLSSMSGVPQGMKVLTEEETENSLKEAVVAPSVAPPPSPSVALHRSSSENFGEAWGSSAPPPPTIHRSVSEPVFNEEPRAKEKPQEVKREKPARPEFEGTWADESDDDGHFLAKLPELPEISKREASAEDEQRMGGEQASRTSQQDRGEAADEADEGRQGNRDRRRRDTRKRNDEQPMRERNDFQPNESRGRGGADRARRPPPARREQSDYSSKESETRPMHTGGSWQAMRAAGRYIPPARQNYYEDPRVASHAERNGQDGNGLRVTATSDGSRRVISSQANQGRQNRTRGKDPPFPPLPP